MDQALQGKIGKFTLPEIFQLIANGKKTGTLGIQNDDDIVMVYFREGRITYGYGPRQTSHIGQLLSDSGKISAGQLEDAISYQSATDVTKRLGRILVEKKYVTRDDLNEAVKRQVEELIYSLLTWEHGSFKFYDNQYPTDEEIMVDLSVENVILEGLRRIDEVNHLREALPDFDKPLKISEATSGRGKDISLEPEEWNLLAMIDGRSSINDIIKQSDYPEAKTIERLASLKLAGLVSESEKPSERNDHLAMMVNRVSGLLEDYLTYRTGEISKKTVGEGNN
ncbi:MAG: hypothetical protein DRP51_06600 [Candidatus Zixiibacteriota bacterium]|nr:MAG: hypothetical protein DRP51_06600 [candidate division Zixibacteria bacterium]